MSNWGLEGFVAEPARTLTDADIEAIADALAERFGRQKKDAPAKPPRKHEPIDAVRARVAEKLRRKGIR